MINRWYTPQQLMDLPGMPSTVQGVRYKAKAESWKSQKQAVGKGFEYHISSLPALTQAHLHQLETKSKSSREVTAARLVLDADSMSKIGLKTELQQQFLTLPTAKQQTALDRKALLDELDNFVEQFAKQGRKTEAVNAWAAQHDLKVPTLYRWRKAYADKGLMGLVDTRGGTMQLMLDEQHGLQEFLIALVTGKPHLIDQYKKLRSEAIKKAPDFGWEVPSTGAIRRWITRWHEQNIAAFTSLTNPDAYNNSHRPLYGTMYPWLSGPNQVWEFDSTPTDVMLNATGKLRRYAVVAAIDVYTRRPMVMVTPSSNSEGICLLLRRCMMTWGMLEQDGVARTDNGSDYVSQRVTGIFDLLDYRQERTRPFSGWEKPFIERFFGTLSRALFELLPAYIGHSVSDRQKIEAAKAFAQRIGGKNKAANEAEALELAMTPAELQKMIDDWISYDYMHQVHEGFKGELKGKTPFEVYAQCRYVPQFVANPHSLDMLLNHVGDATVIRGSVSAGSVKYTAPELQESVWDRKRVRVFLDPADVGRATLYALDDWKLCVEAVNLDLIGRDIDPAAFRQARKDDKKVLASFRRAARELQDKFNIDTLAAEGLAKAAAERGSLTSFVPKKEVTDNAALSALSLSSSSADDAHLHRISQVANTVGEAARKVNESHATAMRTEHEKAQELTLASIERQLSEKEQKWLADYRRKYRLISRRLDQLKSEAKKAAN